ncbi:MAG: TonB-dependent receptor [wastewater metagenome]|nr:TonB-dependent receptor [Candidatus Loosdrechtia aerotolerans]
MNYSIRIPFGISFFHPSGFIVRLVSTFVNQRGNFGDPTVETVESGEDQFWIFDAAVGYRLPKRWGLITVEAKNLFDEELRFQDTDPSDPLIIPERLVLFSFTLAI